MGKLKAAIVALKSDAEALESKVADVFGTRKGFIDSYLTTLDFCRAGAETIYLYLQERFKSKGEKFEDHMKDTIKQLIDPKMAKLVKGVDDAQRNFAKMTAQAKGVNDLVAKLAEQTTKVQDASKKVSEMIKRRKASWLKSPQYKARVATYETAVAELDKQFAATAKMLKTKANVLTKNPVDPAVYKYTANTTLEAIYATCGTYLDLDKAMTPEQDAEQVKTFRGKPFSKQLDVLKKWTNEADTMEKASEEG